MVKNPITNNDRLMQKTGIMIVYAWVLLAVGFFILTAWDPSYLSSSEDYVSILAIIGGPALLIVTKIIETWNQEKQMQLQDYEAQAGHERAMNEILVKHDADMERNPNIESITLSKETKIEGLEEDTLKDLESKISDLTDLVTHLVTEAEKND